MMDDLSPSTPLWFIEEHIQLIFELRQKLDDQAHIQTYLGQRLDLMMDTMTTALERKRCPTREQIFVLAYNA